MTDTVAYILLLVPALVIAIVFHEVAHGYVAKLLGDPTAAERNRLSLNPIRHVDPIGTLVVPGLLVLSGGPVFGWAKPVPVNQNRLDNPRYGMMAVAAAGPLTNLLRALVGEGVLGILKPSVGRGIGGEPGVFVQVMETFIGNNVVLAVFNMLPIPPFDGSHIVEGLLPPGMARTYAKARPYGMLLFFALVALVWFAPGLRVIENTIGIPVYWAFDQYLTLAELIAGR